MIGDERVPPPSGRAAEGLTGSAPRWTGVERGACVRVDRFEIPAGDGPVLDYFIRHHFVAHSLRERLRWFAAEGCRLVGLKTASRFAVFCGTGAPVTNPRARGRSIRLLDDPHGVRPGFVAFEFPPGAREPRSVVKVRPPQAAPSRLRREWDALVDVWYRLPPGLRATVPEPLAYAEEDGVEVLRLAFLEGRPAYLDMRNRLAPSLRVGAHFSAASRWLARFHHALTDEGAPLDVGSELPGPEALARSLDRLSDAGASRSDALAWCRRLHDRLGRERIAAVGVHGDFWARNLLLGDGPLPAVVDWEHFRARGSFGEDLFHFPITYALNHPWRRYRRAAPDEALRLAFLAPNAVSGAVRSYLAGYCRRRGLERSLLRPLFLLHLLGRAASAPADEAKRWLSFHRAVDGTRDTVLDA